MGTEMNCVDFGTKIPNGWTDRTNDSSSASFLVKWQLPFGVFSESRGRVLLEPMRQLSNSVVVHC